MDEEMQMNPDYQLVMRFLSSLTPGSMDKESEDQLRMIGQRIQGGGVLSDKEREMFESVVGAMPMEGANQGSVSDTEMQMYKDSLTPNTGMTDAERQMAEEDAYFQRLREEQEQMYNMNQMQQEGAAPMTSMRPRMRP